MRRGLIAVLTLAGLAGIAVPAVVNTPPWLVWNATPSTPVGLYRVAAARTLAAGDLVAAWPPQAAAELLAARHALPLGLPVIKRVAAVGPAKACRHGAAIRINGHPVAMARARDRAGRALPSWEGCRVLPPGEVFLLGDRADSFDSRYFGPVGRRQIVGRATAIWTPGER